MMRQWFAALCLIGIAGSALAEATEQTARPQARPVVAVAEPDTSAPLADLRPQARPVAATLPEMASVAPVRPAARQETAAALAPQAFVSTKSMRPELRPYLRPELARGAITLPEARAELAVFAFSPTAPMFSLRPTVRPAAFVQRAEREQVARVRGQICGNPDIQGEAIGYVSGPGACGVEDAVRVRSVSGVNLSSQSTMDCNTARALNTWVRDGAIPAVGGTGGGIAALRVVGDYSCRNRNNGSSGKLSEHAHGRAIDIAGIRLKSGRELTVLTDWGRGEAGRQLRAMWRAACGPFGTVLGPDANRYHRDHFHFDTARYRSGSYCQ